MPALRNLVNFSGPENLTQVCFLARSERPEKNLVQKLALLFWTFHYAKRILETFFVHRYAGSNSDSQSLCLH